MKFRTKLLFAFAITVLMAVGLVTFVVAESTRSAFERLDSQRAAALVAQFRREFARRQSEVERAAERMAGAEILQRIAADPDPAFYVEEARPLAAAQGLDFAVIADSSGAIISSAQWPARFGYRDEWVARMGASGADAAQLKREELPEEIALALVAVRTVSAGDRKVYVAAGEKLDRDFLASLELPAGMRVLLYRNLQPEFSSAALTGAAGPPADASRLATFIESVRRDRREIARIVDGEYLHAIPLLGRDNDLLAILLVGGSRADLLRLESFIRRLGLGVGAAGVVLALLVAWWATARITRPVHELAGAAREVAAGNWSAQVHVRSGDEIGELATAFNQMTRELIDQRERLVQSERVAAWRELARRLAHELKNPLFPLQITIENMQIARERYPEQFDEVFRESCQTLLAELGALKTIVNRFSDFSKMPHPERQPTDLNALVRGVVKLFEPQLERQSVAQRLELDAGLPAADADPAQMKRALQNLVLNALDAMPAGGTLTLRTARANGSLRIEVADTGSGLTPEECARLFTPYYTTKQHGTGLGLAIVQSVVSDHGGAVSVESQPGAGSTFRIELKNGTPAHH